MSGKKWFALFLAALALVFVVWAALNILVDPFGVYGDVLLDWDSYTQTLNPRNSKAVYISEHFDAYDSYVIGSSSAASYEPEELEKYLDGQFYNMFHYGADPEYDEMLVSYLLEHDSDVKYIFLVLGLNEANAGHSDNTALTNHTYYKVTGESPLSYYTSFLFASPSYAFEKLSSWHQDTEMPQTFDVFLPDSGCYDKRLRDVESIGSLDAYLEKNGGDFVSPQATGAQLKNIEACVEHVSAIQDMCDDAGVELFVVLSPVCQQQLEEYDPASLDQFYRQLAQEVDYWNFSISSVTYDQRYFYDSTHTRNATADMVLARMFGNSDLYYPDQFGVYCKNGACVTAEELEASAREVLGTPHTANVPILLYHHLSPADPESGTVLHPETFARQMELLEEQGYNPVDFDDLIAYVEQGSPLPEHPVVITFDDGYLSNYEYAFPILQEHGYPATIFAIGCSIGHYEYYKDTEYTLTPHFGQPEIDEMLASGLISIESHTYDMHQWAPFEPEGALIRGNLLPLESDTEASYIAAVTEDAQRQRETFAAFGIPESNVLAFPNGMYTTLTDVIAEACGFQVTVTTDNTRVNTLVQGLPQSLVDLGRLNIDEATTDQDILNYLAQ